MGSLAELTEKFHSVWALLDERTRRIMAAVDDLLGLAAFDEDDLYAALDWLAQEPGLQGRNASWRYRKNRDYRCYVGPPALPFRCVG